MLNMVFSVAQGRPATPPMHGKNQGHVKWFKMMRFLADKTFAIMHFYIHLAAAFFPEFDGALLHLFMHCMPTVYYNVKLKAGCSTCMYIIRTKLGNEINTQLKEIPS